MGDYYEDFLAWLGIWDRASYERHWREAARRLADGASSTAFITSAYQFRWHIWRLGTGYVAQERLIGIAGSRLPFDPTDPFGDIDNYSSRSLDGHPLSEWSISAEDMAAFLARQRDGF